MVFEAMLRVGALLQAPAIASGSTEMASVYYLSKYISKGSTDDKRKYATWKFHRQVLANFMWTCIQMQHMKHTFTICVMDSGLTCMTFAADRKWLEITESQRHTQARRGTVSGGLSGYRSKIISCQVAAAEE